MAMACLGLVTFLPLPPLLSLPWCMAFISRSTLLPAAGEYLRELDFFAEDFFAAAFFALDFFAGDLLEEDLADVFFGAVFFVALFFAGAFFAGDLLDDFFAGDFFAAGFFAVAIGCLLHVGVLIARFALHHK